MPANNYHSDLEAHVLRTLVYFDIFNYPLKAGEVFKFLRKGHCSSQGVNDCLRDLTERKRIFQFGELYGLHEDTRNVNRRLKGNAEAVKWLEIAKERAKFIAKFPFVRAVMASGSLSKGYMDEKSDLDFFIVTAPGRLWLARTLLVLYKRLFLRNCHKQFCVNYFVDAEHLEIEEKNIFTATELITLIPLYNEQLYKSVLETNAWVRGIFPNFRPAPAIAPSWSGASFVRRFFESVLLPLAAALDVLFMKVSLRRWLRLYGNKYSKDDFDIAFKTRRHVSKNHPNHYQKKVLDRYQRKLAELESRMAPADNV